MAFKKDPIEYVTGEGRPKAVKALEAYRSGYTGYWFDEFASRSEPDVVGPWDFLAVSTLSVTVPADVAVWCVNDGAEQLTELLQQVPKGQAIWDPAADLSSTGPVWRVWDLLRERKGLGRTITSKLLAAKRPHLIPVFDQYVAGALLDDAKAGEWWEPWRQRLSDPGGEALRSAVEAVRAEAGYDPNVSILRVLDIVIWMREHGGK